MKIKNIKVLKHIKKNLPTMSNYEIEKDVTEAIAQVRRQQYNKSIRIQYYLGIVLVVLLLIGALFA